MSELPIRRHALILDYLAQHEGARTTELATRLNVTRETIRTDLAHLSERNLLRLVRGGAVAAGMREPERKDRLSANPQGKAAIAALAAGLVPDGARVILDSGSTTFALAKLLRARSGLKIWTNDIAIALELMPVAEVTLLGGQLDATERTLGGPDAIEMMQGYGADLAFVSLGGLSALQGLTDFDRSGLALRQSMVRAATEAYFLADHRKFGRDAPLRWKPQAQARAVICDRAPDASITQQLEAHGLSLIVPDPS
ncbi:DeoR/GlpR family DNA-binding transcription regulator [Hoeflea ulvae]|uniref:DeoR/GlpR family DNA-binding transcription regulator n=1 Tax=Hoeflea ulvae TaxID=2983764 RepID=A0ABT3YFX2_9HYPH|nr:DeoR/GlpR family DNA-binding transcription regulator [Hoeflea ulvae]MCY0094790.1 DeoR/GlpR family DNA-binding transcription regulator [Hoeflea ulvae]